ncbi:hypothetical protein ACOMHN_044679 [Nucella lapillus]
MLCQCHTSTRTTGQAFVPHAVPVSYINKDHRSDLCSLLMCQCHTTQSDKDHRSGLCSPCCASVIHPQGPQVRPLFPMLCQCHTSTRTTGQAFVPHAVPVSYINTEGDNKDHRSDLCYPCCASVIHQQGPQVRPCSPCCASVIHQHRATTRTTGQTFVPHAVPVSYINKDHRSGLCSPCCASVIHQQGPQVRPLFPMLCQCHTSTQGDNKDHRSDLCSPCCASVIHQHRGQRATTRTTGQAFVPHAVPVSYIHKDHRSGLCSPCCASVIHQQGPQVRPLFPMLCQCHTSTRTTGQTFVPHAVPVSHINTEGDNKDHRSDLCSPCCASVIHPQGPQVRPLFPMLCQCHTSTRTIGQAFVPHAVPVSYINKDHRSDLCSLLMCQCHTSTQRATRTTGQAFVPHAVPVSYIHKDHRSGLCSRCCASVTHQQGPQVRPLFPMLCQCHTSTQRVTTRTTGQTFVPHAVTVSYINKDHRSDLCSPCCASVIHQHRATTRTTGQVFVPHAVPVSYINKDHRSDICSPCCASVIHQHRATTRTTGQTFVPHAVPVSYINTEGRGRQQGPQVRPLFPMLCQCHTSTRTTGQAFVPHAVPVSYINTERQGPQVRPLFPMLCQCHTSTQGDNKDHRG